MANPSPAPVTPSNSTAAPAQTAAVAATASLVIPQSDLWRGDPAAEQKIKETSQLQQALSQIVAKDGKPYLDPDAIKGIGLGVYGRRTEAAVLAYQQEYNSKHEGDASRRKLRESGAADRVTRAALKSELSECKVTIQVAPGAAPGATPAVPPGAKPASPGTAPATTPAVAPTNAGDLIDEYEKNAKASGLALKSKDWRAVYGQALPTIQADFLKVAEKVDGEISAYRDLKEERDSLAQQIKDAKLDELKKFDGGAIGVFNGPIAKAVDDLNGRVAKLDHKIDQATGQLKNALQSFDATMEAGSDQSKLSAGLAATATKITTAGEAIHDAYGEVSGMAQQDFPQAVSKINEDKKEIQKTTLEKEKDKLGSELEAIDLQAQEARKTYIYTRPEDGREMRYNELVEEVEKGTKLVGNLENRVKKNNNDPSAPQELADAQKALAAYAGAVKSIETKADGEFVDKRKAIIDAQNANDKALSELLERPPTGTGGH